MLRKSVTQQYPEVKPDLPPRSRGVIALVEENCTSCMLCARECPDWCIYIDSHKETIPAPEGGRARQRNVLDRFAIDFALCMYCGICIEVCPFDALFWAPEFEYAEGDIRNLLHEKDKLATWVPSVPPPPAHEVGAEPPKELTAAPRRPAADRPARTPAAQRPRTVPEKTTPQETVPQETAPEEQAPSATAEPAPETGPAAPPSRTPGGRPRRPMTNVRGIRPPGALPSTPPSGTPSQQEGAANAEPGSAGEQTRPQNDRPQGDRPQGDRQEGERPGRSQEAARGESQPEGQEAAQGESQREGQKAAQDEPQRQGQEAQDQASSTGQPPEDKLSTAAAESRSKPENEEQTSSASPRRRRMADPRSIRPPGRLGPDEPKESEEES
ncbi:4Fe-4S binding protein [[Actinomadura] parvosata]|uniref:4Fe-4S binding protein n=1 Tax=[Actinomadura] parvosata TaxID=1955412 RepID=UPI001E56A5F3|nr:4Fe-4S binding protein [Nonomuraea sp. ATCC 55076]